MAGAEQSRPRGWYDHPTDAGAEALWNGKRWTGHVRRKGDPQTGRDRALKRAATFIGLAVLVPVLLVTFLPTKAGAFDCGTWINRSHPVATGSYAGTLAGSFAENVVDNECGNKLDNRRLWALVLLGAGLVIRFSFVPVVKAVQHPIST